MKAREFVEMTNDELKVKLVALKQELLNLRFKNATGQLENANLLPACRKDIARVLTVLKQRELGLAEAPEATEKPKRKRATKKA